MSLRGRVEGDCLEFMSFRDPVTILHLSDPQFGANHLSGDSDELLQRLVTSLTELREDKGLAPDLLILTGDLAERGLPKEFEQARRLIDGLHEHLGVGPERTVVIPGNHDINWGHCKSHFNDQEGYGERPPLALLAEVDQLPQLLRGSVPRDPGLFL
jgi:predicted MPP superfamily phosphohydrolase